MKNAILIWFIIRKIENLPISIEIILLSAVKHFSKQPTLYYWRNNIGMKQVKESFASIPLTPPFSLIQIRENTNNNN